MPEGNHNPEKDARATFKCYLKYSRYPHRQLLSENGDEVRDLIKSGKTINDFTKMVGTGLIKNHGRSVKQLKVGIGQAHQKSNKMLGMVLGNGRRRPRHKIWIGMILGIGNKD